MSENRDIMSGQVKISKDVIASVAMVAAGRIEGVKLVCGKKVGKGLKKAGKHLRIAVTDNGVTIDMNIAVRYGYLIPEVGYAVQENVQDCVESMTGLKVEQVNVHCTGIVFNKEEILQGE